MTLFGFLRCYPAMQRKKWLVLLMMGLWTSACTQEPVIPEKSISFSSTISPLIKNNCASANGCHGASGGEARSLTSYDDVMHYADATGKKAMKSKLMHAITALNGEEAMPPGNPLPDEQIKTIYIWLLQGAPNN